jgi:hypothetical protein
MRPLSFCHLHLASAALLLALVLLGAGCSCDGAVGQDATDAGDSQNSDAATCELTESPCGGGCADTTYDPANCGECGQSCTDGNFCLEGRCADTCPTDYLVCGDACVGGTDEAIRLHDDTHLNGFVYAVEGRVNATHPVTVFGGLFAGEFTSLGDTTLHYDRAVLSAGDNCDPPGDDDCTNTCTDCGSSLACVDGTCGGCTSDADCCAPTTCYMGSCTTLID